MCSALAACAACVYSPIHIFSSAHGIDGSVAHGSLEHANHCRPRSERHPSGFIIANVFHRRRNGDDIHVSQQGSFTTPSLHPLGCLLYPDRYNDGASRAPQAERACRAGGRQGAISDRSEWSQALDRPLLRDHSRQQDPGLLRCGVLRRREAPALRVGPDRSGDGQGATASASGRRVRRRVLARREPNGRRHAEPQNGGHCLGRGCLGAEGASGAA